VAQVEWADVVELLEFAERSGFDARTVIAASEQLTISGAGTLIRDDA
jgi:hypothetical protein